MCQYKVFNQGLSINICPPLLIVHEDFFGIKFETKQRNNITSKVTFMLKKPSIRGSKYKLKLQAFEKRPVDEKGDLFKS